MSFLKKIPMVYQGELHNIRLVNFYVDREEILPFVPKPLRVRDFNGRAMISLVNVELKKMHPSFLPEALNFEYRHVAFRLVLEDAHLNEGQNKGIFFLRSFSDKAQIVAGGKLLTDYNLEKAEIQCLDRMMELKQGNRYFNYALEPGSIADYGKEQTHTIASLDRAYAVSGNEVKMTRIQREKWPIRPVNCYLLETNFFKSAEFVSAFMVDEIIPYKWLAPEILQQCA